jgi:prophage antirepressor-like protein
MIGVMLPGNFLYTEISMNALQAFQFQTHQLNVVVDEHGEPWFIAKHVAEILEYSDAFKMTSKLDADEVQNRQIGGFGNRGVNLINESGLYSAILTSQKPAAKAFKRWVTSEVLPSIRKTGGYGVSNGVGLTELQYKQIALITENNQLKSELLDLYRQRERLPMPTQTGRVRRNWSAGEDQTLRNFRLQGLGPRRIARKMNRSMDSVAHRIRKLGV